MSGTISQAVILVGGLGTRLGRLTKAAPKPMLEVGGTPFLDWLIAEIGRAGFRRILLLAGHLGEQVEARYAGKRRCGAEIEVLREPTPLGTGGALRYARSRLDSHFLLLNGDSLFETDLRSFAAEGLPEGVAARMALRSDAPGARYGRVRFASGRIVGFSEAGAEASGPINAGIYLVGREALDALWDGASSLERDLFPALADEGRLAGSLRDGYFIDIGVPGDFARAQSEVPRRLRRPAAFLDRDGVLNVDAGYVHRIDDFEWMKGAAAAVRRLNESGRLVFVVTNQAGVARGYYGEETVLALHRWMDEELRRLGARIDEFAYCPHHPDGVAPEYRRACHRRKPEPGMLLDLMEEWQVRREGSFLIGDRETDLAAADAAGIPARRFRGGDLEAFVDETLAVVDRATSG